MTEFIDSDIDLNFNDNNNLGFPKPTNIVILSDSEPTETINSNKKNITRQILKQKNISSEKKWIISIFIASVVILICSSFSVMAFDNFFHNAFKIDIFNTEDNRNEKILAVVQFFVILFLVRLILKYY